MKSSVFNGKGDVLLANDKWNSYENGVLRSNSKRVGTDNIAVEDTYTAPNGKTVPFLGYGYAQRKTAWSGNSFTYSFTPEEFEKVINETSFYLPLEESDFSSVQYLNDEQLKEVLTYQERQLHATREGIDQAAYEIVEDGADISDIDDWVKNFKVGMSNLRQILSEQLIRSERKQEKDQQEKTERNTARSLKI